MSGLKKINKLNLGALKAKFETDGTEPKYGYYARECVLKFSPNAFCIDNYEDSDDSLLGECRAGDVEQLYFNPDTLDIIKIMWSWGCCASCDQHRGCNDDEVIKIFNEQHIQILTFDEIFKSEMNQKKKDEMNNHVHHVNQDFIICRDLFIELQDMNHI